MKGFLSAIALLLVAVGPVSSAQAEQPCERCDVAEGYYLAAAPEGWDGVSPLPLVVFFHAWGKSPRDVMQAKALVAPLHERGALVVAPYARNGYWRQIGEGRAERGRDEAAYVRRVLRDVRRRWPIDESRILASGYSRGASLVWNLACYEAELFTAYAPFSGGFWSSTPRDCPSGPAALRHIHGAADRMVAFGEVGIYDSRPIPEGLALFRRLNGANGPAQEQRLGAATCRRWSGERPVEVCLHQGGHWFPPEWLADSFDWMVENVSAPAQR